MLRTLGVAVFAVQVATCFKYDLHYGMERGAGGQRAYNLSEGPMYADGQGPFANGPSEIVISFVGKVENSAACSISALTLAAVQLNR